MKHWTFLPIALLILTGCASAPKNTLTQISTIDALLAGAYDGQMTLAELSRHGTFGLGTFNALDGEMIALDGEIWQAKSDGTLHRPCMNETTPFAALVNFEADQTIEMAPDGTLSYAELQAFINQKAPNQNLFLAVRADGTFSKVKVRVIPRQQKPYPPLIEAAKVQPVYEYTNVTGTLLGFRCPAYVQGINVPGYHLHFISDDRSVGGHVLEVGLQDAELQLDSCNRFNLILPEAEHFGSLDLTKDRSQELKKVEQ
jgi:acetolactate decarboxylase